MSFTVQYRRPLSTVARTSIKKNATRHRATRRPPPKHQVSKLARAPSKCQPCPRGDLGGGRAPEGAVPFHTCKFPELGSNTPNFHPHLLPFPLRMYCNPLLSWLSPPLFPQYLRCQLSCRAFLRRWGYLELLGETAPFALGLMLSC